MKCEICGFTGKSLVSHIVRKHHISVDEYKEQFNVKSVHYISEEQKLYLSNMWTERMKDPYWITKMSENKQSVWKVDYWISIGFSESDAILKVKEYQSNNSKKRDYTKSPTILSVEYYTNRGVDEETAIENIRKIQSKLSAKSNKFRGRKHSTESKNKIRNGMINHIHKVGVDEWVSHYGDLSDPIYRSKGEVELFNIVSNITKGYISANKFICGYNVDILCDKKIIEYFGDYWHCNPTVYSSDYFHSKVNKTASEIWEADSLRKRVLLDSGYNVLVIWESDFKNGTQYIEDRIRKFLYDT